MLERRLFPVLMVVPAVATMMAVVVYPLGVVVWLAFHDWNLRRSPTGPLFVGLANFQRLLGDAVFWQSFANTVYYVAMSVTGEFLLGLGLALILFRSSRGVAVIRSIIMIPLFIVPVIVALIWRILLNQDFGPIYYILKIIGLANPREAFGLSNPTLAMPLIATVSVWQVMPFIFLVFVAGMQSVPQEQYEAAKLDGASGFQEFLYVTLPWLKPLILFIILIRVMDAFKVFDLVIMLTGGGPGSVTEVASLYIYRQAFQYFNMGYAAILSLVLLAVIFAFSLILINVMRIQRHV